MDTVAIIASLKSERDRLANAIDALSKDGSSHGKQRRRPGPMPGRKRRPLSAAAKRRIGRAMKASWAARKKSA